MKIIFLGTNGWFDTQTGNTVCILVETEQEYLILDAGNGFYKIDQYITRPKPIYLFITHFHLDHIVGLHILNKFLFPQGIDVIGPPGTRKTLPSILRQPFSAPIKVLKTQLRLHEPSYLAKLPFPVVSKRLVHVSPCYGYRFNLEHKVLTYCTDTGPCRNFSELARGADLLISECAYKANENPHWPHMNPETAAGLAREVGVKKLALLHFDASLYPTLADRKEAQVRARKIFRKAFTARDGQEIVL